MMWRITTLVAAGMLGGYIGFMASDRDVPIQYKSMAPTKEFVFKGTDLVIKHEALRRRSCATVVNRLIFDNHQERHVIPDLIFPEGLLPVGQDTFTVSITIPEKAAPGEATYRVVRHYKCNLLHNFWPITDGPYEFKFIIVE